MRGKCLRSICLALAIGLFSSTAISINVSANQNENVKVGRDYYISSLNGDNSNDATTPNKAWQTLDKLAEIELQPGDRVLLESGSVFNGFIHLKDVRGTEESPIEITKYGGDVKPIINGNAEGVWYQDFVAPMDNPNHQGKGYVSSTILLYDTDFIKINNLELTNESDDLDYLNGRDKLTDRMDRTGVGAIAKNGGTMEGIHLEDLYIHDVDGNIENKVMNNGGIQMNVLKPDNESETGIARFDDILIKGCHVKHVSRAGISLGYTYHHNKFNGAAISDEAIEKYGHSNVVVEENYVQEVGNDGIVVMYADRPLIQKNISDKAGADLLKTTDFWQPICAAIWPWKSKSALFQYNEVFDTVDNPDGQAWDIDSSDGTIYQYNYSHNNGGGALMFCFEEAYNGTFRYNISQNDLKYFIAFQGNPYGEVYNNVFYVDGDRRTRVHSRWGGGEGYLANNIFYNISTNNPNDNWEQGNNKEFTNNIYYGYNSVPSTDKYAITEDPKFVAPGNAPTTASEDGKIHERDVFDGYKVAADSPAINAGVYVSGNTDKDFFGNPIGVLRPDIGVYEVDPGNEENIKEIFSEIYKVNGDRIERVEINTIVGEFLSNFIYSNGVKLEVLNGTEVLDETDTVVNGNTLKVTFVDGSIKEYTIVVPKIKSEFYIIKENSIDGISRETTVEEFLSKFVYSKGAKLEVLNKAGVVNGTDIVKNGNKLRGSYADGTVDEYTLIVDTTYSPEGMTATEGSYQKNNATEGPGSFALDNNLDTMWCTDWSGCNRSEAWINIDMGKVQPVSSLKYVPRSNISNGIITKYSIFVKENENDEWIKVATESDTWELSTDTKYAYFEPINARYVKLQADESYSLTDKIYVTAREIRLGLEEND